MVLITGTYEFVRQQVKFTFLLLLFFFCLKSGSVILAQPQTFTQTFTTSGTFKIPAGVVSVNVQAWGAGGGGSSISSKNARGGGGGGGAFSSGTITVNPGTSYNVIVGQGGIANSDGGKSEFGNNLIKAEGGKGASNNSVNAGSGGSYLNGIGSVTYSGGNGANGGSTYSGGGGGGAGSDGNGGNASGRYAGTGTDNNGGDGGAGKSGSGNGETGSVYGGGGSGAVTNTNTDRTGGSGADGLVIIKWIVYPALSGNSIDFVNGLHGVICSSVQEHQTASLSAPSGTVFSYVDFASYGTPNGTCPGFTIGDCNATTSRTIAETYLLGNNSASIAAENSVFGDPCVGTFKRLYITSTYTEPVFAGSLPGTITGSLPTGGNDTYSYLWESSTSGFSSGFSAATGVNNSQDYAPAALYQTTWFRRTVTSAGMSNTSPAIQVTVVPVTIFIWMGTIDSDWHKAGNWLGGVPSSESDVAIPQRLNQPVISSEAECNNLTIGADAVATVSSSGSLTVNGTLVNQNGASGLILESDASGSASMLHNTNNVHATYKQSITGNSEAWHLLSSPVADQPISGDWLTAGTYGNGTGYDLYVWNEQTNCWIYKLDVTNAVNWNTVHPGSDFMTGRGYLYSVQALNPVKSFAGMLNNGSFSVSVTSGSSDVTMKGLNLLGNPYPSAIDWQASSGWDRSVLETAGGGYNMWIWNPSENNYGVINSTGGTGTNGVTRYIQPAQGFFVKAVSGGNVGFSNNIRRSSVSGSWLKKGEGNALNIVSAAIKSDNGFGSDEVQLIFGSEKEESGAVKIFSPVESAPSLYMNDFSGDLSVRYLYDTVSVPSVKLYFKAGSNGKFTFRAAFDRNEFRTMILEDRKTGSIKDLKENGEYVFTASVKDNPERFVLHFSNSVKTETTVFSPKVYQSGSNLAVDLSGYNGKTEISVYDLMGRCLIDDEIYSDGISVFDVNSKTQLLIIRLRNSGYMVSSKIMWIQK